MWDSGVINLVDCIAEYEVEHYEEPSEFGFNHGKVSKLTIKINDEIVACYDRGWVVWPDTELGLEAFMTVLRMYNH